MVRKKKARERESGRGKDWEKEDRVRKWNENGIE